jgi:hypothetical protein
MKKIRGNPLEITENELKYDMYALDYAENSDRTRKYTPVNSVKRFS